MAPLHRQPPGSSARRHRFGRQAQATAVLAAAARARSVVLTRRRREGEAALDFEEVGKDLNLAGDELQKEVECAADEGSRGLIQRKWKGEFEGGKRLGRVAGAEDAGGGDRGDLRENSNNINVVKLATKKSTALFNEGKVLQQNRILRDGES